MSDLASEDLQGEKKDLRRILSYRSAGASEDERSDYLA